MAGPKMRRRWAGCGLLAAVLLPAQACRAPEPFSCSDDGQCVLSGTPGICTAAGHCAYPDATCESGYAFPFGSPSSEAGMCAPVDGSAATAGGGATGAGADGSSGPGLDGVGDSGAMTGATEDDGPAQTDTNGTGTGGTPGTCRDAIGNDPVSAVAEPLCLPMLSDVLVDAADEDFFALGSGPIGPCENSGYNANVVEGAVEACIFAGCTNPDHTIVSCDPRSQTTNFGALVGCCSQSMAQGRFECEDESPFEELYLAVRSADAIGACEPYTVDIYGTPLR